MNSLRVFYKIFLSLLLLLVCATYSYGATVAGYSEYYIPGGEDEMSLALRSFGATAIVNMEALIAITAWSDNITIYYDHWENGLGFDPNNPAATADETFTLATTGTILTLDNTPVGGIPIPRNSASTYYDGGDRIYVAGGAVTVTRVSWRYNLAGVGRAIQAVAWEIYPIKPQLTTYILPFGENLSGSFPDFLRTYVIVQATADNTSLTVDLDGNGTPDPLDQNFDGDTTDPGDTSTVTLQAGQSFFIGNVPINPSPMPRGARATVNSGAVIQGSSTLQVKFVVGDPTATYETRGISAFPRGYWTKDYYAPVGGTANAKFNDIFLYNPSVTGLITITWESLTGSGSFTIGSNATVSFLAATGLTDLPAAGGVYLKGSDVFWGASTIDSTAATNEWAYSLLPSTLLYDDHFLGWAPGGADGNDSGVFLMVAQDNTRVFVDTDNDGTADQTYTLNRLQTQYITDPTDFDLSGTHFWATGPFTMSYGQNPDTAPAQATSGDLGYVAIPSADFISLVLTVDKSVSPQVLPTASDSVATFTIKINSQKYTVDGVNVTDYLPPNWQYLIGTDTTTITWPDMTTHSTDPSVSGVPATGQTLSWTSAQLGTNGTPGMAENQEGTVTFTARTTAVLAVGTLSQNRVKAVGTRTFASQTQTFTTTDFVYVATGNSLTLPVEQITKTSSATDPLYPGNQFTYTVAVTNPVAATANLTGISIYDSMPAGTSYVAGSSQVTGWRTTTLTDNVRDTFASQAYNRNDGSVNWVGSWVESDATQNPSAGYVLITGGELRLGGTTGTSTSNIYRQVDLSSATSASLTLDYRTTNLDNPDHTYIEIAGSPSGPWTNVLDFQNDQTGSINYTIPNTLWTSTTTIRFRTTNYNTTDEYLYIDNVDISYIHPVSSSGTWAGGNTPNFVSSSDGYFAAPGNSLTLTYDVIVDDPLAAGITEITNTAYVNSNEIILPLSASVTNLVVNPSSGSASVGDRVWLDADGDGVLDVGEPGLANIEVTLKDQFGTPLMTTTTDATGHYLFTGVVPDDGYYVEVSPGTLPAGLEQSAPSGHTDNRTGPFNFRFSYGNNRDDFGVRAYNNSDGTVAWTNTWQENDINGATGGNIQVVTAATPAELRITANASYIYRDLNIPADATNATLSFDWRTTGVEAIDSMRLRISTDGTNYTTLATFTGIVGVGSGHQDIDISSYLNLTALTRIRFEVNAGYTGADDYFFVDYVNVAYYSIRDYLDADLGYTSATGSAVIGNLVWSDFNSNGLRDAGEAGLAGVTVQLWRDTNSNGILEPGTDTLCDIATCGTNGATTTAAGGSYLFTGVTANGSLDYLVYVDETQAQLTGYTRTTTIAFSILNINAGASILSANFGFYSATTYSIKDRVWFDADGNGSQSGVSETGISLVTVDLLDASLNAIATTTTDANGDFTFSGVIGGGADYTIKITDTNGKLADYYGTTTSAITGTKQVPNLTANVDYTAAPDFGYGLNSSIGDTVFNDINNNGVQDLGENGFSGITVKLYSDTGVPGVIDGSDAVVATLTTDANGIYLFSGLSDGNYIVSVETPPSGYTYLGTDSDSGTTGQQQAASISGGSTALDKDFRYQAGIPRSASGTIWNDADADGVIDGTEALLAGVTIDLLQGSTVIATTSTAADGSYSFSGLVSGTYTVKVTDNIGVLSGFVATYEKTGGTGGPFDGEEIVDLSSGNQTGVDFGYNNPTPTLVILTDFSAYNENGQVRVEWTTSSEIDTAGFFLFRLDESTGKYRQINRRLLPALLNSHQGGAYSLIDNGASLENGNTYVLVEIEGKGAKNSYGPFTVIAGGSNAVESQYTSGAKAAGAFLSSFDRSAEVRSREITRYVDKEGTIVITNSGGKSSRGAENSVADEVSDYRQTLKAVSAEKTTRLSLRKETKAQGRLLRSQRQGAMVKIAIEKDGLYYLSSSEISRLTGIFQNTVQDYIRKANLALSNHGNPVAYLPAEDYSGIYFYGQGTDSIYTKENIYWLYKGNGLQMGSTGGSVPASAVDITFTDTVHAEEDILLAAYPFLDPEADFWFWDWISSGSPGYDTKTFNIDTTGAAATPSSTATLYINLQGFSETPSDPDHHVQVSVNGTVLYNDDLLNWWNVRWDGTKKHSSRFEFSQSLLNSGTNTIQVKGLLDTGAPWSVFYIDSFDLSYQRPYEALDNSLLLTGEANPTVTVYGFTGPDILVLDVTDPLKPVLKAATTEPYNGKYSASFVPSSPESLYLAITAGAADSPHAWADSPSQLINRKNQADYILIAPEELIAGAQELAAYRQKKGLKSMVVKVEDIMDEFNYGLSSPKAIQAFLTYAYNNWNRPPKYVVLVGDGTYDYRDNLHFSEDLVPTMVVKTPDGLFTSDNVLADVNADHVPEMAIGRLPVISPEELHNVTTKIIAYERNAGEHNAGNRILMLADNPDNGGDFTADSNDLAALIPSTYRVNKIYLSQYQINEARQMLFSEINSGTSLINYIGHASSDNLAAENLLGKDDMRFLSNSARPFVLSAMTCMTGQYAFPGEDSLSETLMLKKDGGAAAVWAPSGLAFNSDSKLLAEYFIRTALKKRGMFLGSAILDSFRSFNSQGGPSYVLDIYTLQGDPALKLW